MDKKKLPKREYHDGNIVEFDFEPNYLKVYWHKVTIIGMITGVNYEKGGILYNVQLRDDKRNINGTMTVPEEKISGKIADSVMTIKCDFCDIRIHVNQKDKGDIEKKTKGWEKLYCIGEEHHLLNICHRCMEIFGNVDDKKCPYDLYEVMPERQYIEEHGNEIIDDL